MMASDEVIIRLAELSIQTVTSAIKSIREYKRQNTYFPTYYQYPERFLKGIEETVEYVEYNEMKEKIPAFKYGIPFFIMHGYNTPKNYKKHRNMLRSKMILLALFSFDLRRTHYENVSRDHSDREI